MNKQLTHIVNKTSIEEAKETRQVLLVKKPVIKELTAKEMRRTLPLFARLWDWINIRYHPLNTSYYGCYDPCDNEIRILEGMPPALKKPVLEHEMMHWKHMQENPWILPFLKYYLLIALIISFFLVRYLPPYTPLLLLAFVIGIQLYVNYWMEKYAGHNDEIVKAIKEIKKEKAIR